MSGQTVPNVSRIRDLLLPYYPMADTALALRLELYLKLLLKWNARTNLSAIREPEQIVTRHFGESLFAGLQIPAKAVTLMDLGSGAGFPGIPMQLVRPDLKVTLAESQNKKAAFLREATRVLGVDSIIWANRAELLPADVCFDVVTLRAVDQPQEALAEARRRVGAHGVLIHLTTRQEASVECIRIPGSLTGVIESTSFI